MSLTIIYIRSSNKVEKYIVQIEDVILKKREIQSYDSENVRKLSFLLIEACTCFTVSGPTTQPALFVPRRSSPIIPPQHLTQPASVCCSTPPTTLHSLPSHTPPPDDTLKLKRRLLQCQTHLKMEG